VKALLRPKMAAGVYAKIMSKKHELTGEWVDLDIKDVKIAGEIEGLEQELGEDSVEAGATSGEDEEDEYWVFSKTSLEEFDELALSDEEEETWS